MTLRDVRLIAQFWKRNPPVRSLVAAIAVAVGVKLPDPTAPAEADKKYMTGAEFERFVQMTGGGKVAPGLE